jgi:hypothetical protein
MGRLLKFCSLTWRERQYFCEAGILLVLSALCVKTIAFRYIYAFLCARWNGHTQDPFDVVAKIKLVNLSLSRAANLLPWKRLCLSRSIAAFIMLRRRGIPAVIVTGVKFSSADSSLIAHAWIQTGFGVTDENSENAAFTAVVRIGQGPSITVRSPGH